MSQQDSALHMNSQWRWWLHAAMLHETQKIPWFIISQLWLSLDRFICCLAPCKGCRLWKFVPSPTSVVRNRILHCTSTLPWAQLCWQVREASLVGLYTNPSQPELVTQCYRKHFLCSHCCEHEFLPKKSIAAFLELHSAVLSTLHSYVDINPDSNYWPCSSYIVVEM